MTLEQEEREALYKGPVHPGYASRVRVSSLEREEREALKKAAAIIARRGEEAVDYLAKAKASPSPRR